MNPLLIIFSWQHVHGGGGICQAVGGPSYDAVLSFRPYVASHAVAPWNMLTESVTKLVSQPKMCALNADASQNMAYMFVTELVSQPEMSALNAYA